MTNEETNLLFSIAKKYYSAVENYIFSFDDIAVFHLSNINYDELKSSKSLLFYKELKKRISSEWQDKETLSTVFYYALRINICRFFAKWYEERFSCKTLDELFKVHLEQSKALGFDKDNFMLETLLYPYWYVYDNDVFQLDLDEIFKSTKTSLEQMLRELQQKHTIDSYFFNIDNDEKQSLIEKIDLMSGTNFEHFMQKYFNNDGYVAIKTPDSGDYGVDVIITDKLGTKIGIQCKCQKDKVTQSAIREIVAGLPHYKLNTGMVITNNYFTPSAITLAEENNVVLWNRDILIQKISKK